MENQNNKGIVNNSGKVWAGLFIIVIGGLLLLDNLVLDIPKWIFSWYTFLIALGLLIGAKHRFKGGGWIPMILVGTYFLLHENVPREYEIDKFLFPGLLVLIGLFIIFKPKKSFCDDGGNRWQRRQARWHRKSERWGARFGQAPNSPSQNQFPDAQQPVSENPTAANEPTGDTRNDFIDSVNVFGGSQQIIYSKNFRGGDIVAVFGGADINLSQADFEGEIVLEITAVFGGAKIVIPQGWLVKHEVTAILGGLDDKRAIMPLVEGAPKKVLIIKGLAMLGGIEIRNY